MIGLVLAVVASAAATGQGTPTEFTLPSGVEVRIVEAPFKRSQFKVSGCTGDASGCLINGHIPAGLSSDLPKTYVKSISIRFKDRSYDLDASDMYDAWGSRPLQVPGVIRYFGGKCFDSANCQFRGLFSDGGSAFVAEWSIVNGKSVRTVLTASDDVVHLFMANIDPPEFDE